jgi:dipeptidyl aminopeptidase/acylaminoacyl peptidase
VPRALALALGAAVVLGTGMRAAAGAAPLIPLEEFAGYPQLQSPHISPDGNLLVYLGAVAGVPAVIVRDLRSGAERPILHLSSGGYDVSRCEFKNDERLLCHLEGVAHGYGGEPFPASRLVALNADGSDLRVLFADGVADGGSAVGLQFQDRIVHWLPDDPRHLLIELTETGTVFPSVYQLDVYSGSVRLVVPAHPPVMDWTVDNQGVVRFGYGFRGDSAVYIARSGANAPWRTLEQFPRFDRSRFDPLVFGRNPGELFVLAPYQGRLAVWKMDLEGDGDLQLAFSRPDVDVSGIIEWPSDRRVAGFFYETDRPHAEYIDPEAQAVDDLLQQTLPGAFHAVISASRDGKRLITVSYADVLPARFHLVDLTTHQVVPIGRLNSIDPAQLAPMKPVVVPGEGGIRIPGYLTLPLGTAPGARLPAVVLPHGGPYARDSWDYDPLVQMLANRGYAVLQLNFRGSTGYGQAWEEAGHQAWGTIMHEDITSGARWLISAGIADPARLAIVGWSYGGYAALVGVEKEPHLYRCAVSIAGVSDMAELARDDARFYGGQAAASDSMGADQATLASESPVRHAERIQVPVLLVHGKDDYTVLVHESKEMARALSRNHVPHELVLIRHGDHSLKRPEMRLTLYRKLEAFLSTNLAPQQPATPHQSNGAPQRPPAP